MKIEDLQDNGLYGLEDENVETIKEGYIDGENGRIDLEENTVYIIAADTYQSSGYYFIYNNAVYNYGLSHIKFFNNLRNIVNRKSSNHSLEDVVELFWLGGEFDMEDIAEAISESFDTEKIIDISLYN